MKKYIPSIIDGVALTFIFILFSEASTSNNFGTYIFILAILIALLYIFIVMPRVYRTYDVEHEYSSKFYPRLAIIQYAKNNFKHPYLAYIIQGFVSILTFSIIISVIHLILK